MGVRWTVSLKLRLDDETQNTIVMDIKDWNDLPDLKDMKCVLEDWAKDYENPKVDS